MNFNRWLSNFIVLNRSSAENSNKISSFCLHKLANQVRFFMNMIILITRYPVRRKNAMLFENSNKFSDPKTCNANPNVTTTSEMKNPIPMILRLRDWTSFSFKCNPNDCKTFKHNSRGLDKFASILIECWSTSDFVVLCFRMKSDSVRNFSLLQFFHKFYFLNIILVVCDTCSILYIEKRQSLSSTPLIHTSSPHPNTQSFKLTHLSFEIWHQIKRRRRVLMCNTCIEWLASTVRIHTLCYTLKCIIIHWTSDSH